MPPSDLGQAEWLATGRRAGGDRALQSVVDRRLDPLRHRPLGREVHEAARVTGYDVASLRNMAWVASQLDLSLRSDRLSWSHHVLLAPLEQDEQRHWIARAVEQRLSVADLRLELRARRHGGGRDQASEGDGRPQEGEGVCPHCGHKLSGPGD